MGRPIRYLPPPARGRDQKLASFPPSHLNDISKVGCDLIEGVSAGFGVEARQQSSQGAVTVAR